MRFHELGCDQAPARIARNDVRTRRRHLAQRSRGLLAPWLLDVTHQRIQQHDRKNGDGFVGQSGVALVEPRSGRDERCNEQQEDERIVELLRELLKPQSIRRQYTQGVADASLIAPESYALDAALIARLGNDEIQLDLFLDYRTNVAPYPRFQEYFRTRRPPLLATWGRNDPIFLPAGAEAFKRDIPDAEVRLYETGHFALETHAAQMGTDIRHFLARRVGRRIPMNGTVRAR